MKKENIDQEPVIKAKSHESYWPLSLVAIIIPIAGLILGIVYMAKSEKVDRKIGEHLIALSILFSIIGWFFFSQLLRPVMYY